MGQLVFFVFKRYNGKFRKNHKLNEYFLAFNINSRNSILLCIDGECAIDPETKEAIEPSGKLVEEEWIQGNCLIELDRSSISPESYPEFIEDYYNDSESTKILINQEANIRIDSNKKIYVSIKKPQYYLGTNLPIVPWKKIGKFNLYHLEDQGIVDIPLNIVKNEMELKTTVKNKLSLFDGLVKYLRGK